MRRSQRTPRRHLPCDILAGRRDRGGGRPHLPVTRLTPGAARADTFTFRLSHDATDGTMMSPINREAFFADPEVAEMASWVAASFR